MKMCGKLLGIFPCARYLVKKPGYINSYRTLGEKPLFLIGCYSESLVPIALNLGPILLLGDLERKTNSSYQRGDNAARGLWLLQWVEP